jgi:hypothetical protein
MALAALVGSAPNNAAFAQGALLEDEAVYPTFRAMPRFRAFLPEMADLSPFFPKAGFQGSQGSCTGWATGYGLRSYYENRAAARHANSRMGAFSPSFVYNQLKKNPGNCNEGTRISDALRLLETAGAAPFENFPYSPNDCSARPTPAVRGAAQSFRIDEWSRVNTRELDDIKGEISDGHPVVIGMFMTDKLKNLKAGEIYTELVPKSVKTAHAVVVVAYSDAKRAFKIFNSWGSNWADGGFGWISYEALENNINSAFSVRVPKVEKPWGGLQTAKLAVSKPVVAAKPVSPKPEAPNKPPEPEIRPAPKKEPKVEPIPEAKPLPAPKPQPIAQPIPKPELKPKPTPPPEPTLTEKLASLSKGYACSRFDYKVFGGKAARFSGFVSSDDDLAKLKRKLAETAKGIRLNFQVDVREWPQCEALMTFDHPMKNASGLKIGVVGGTVGQHLKDGDKLVIEVTTPNFPSYLYVTYLQSGGDAIHLVRANPSDQPFPPGQRLVFGDDPTQQSFQIASPYGREMIMAIAAPKPLFPDLRVIAEEERRYLTEFRKAILAQTGTQNEGRMAAAYTYLTTHPKPLAEKQAQK